MDERVRSKIPLPLRRAVRKVALDPIDHMISDVRLPKSIEAYRAGKSADRVFVDQLRHAWGNEAWSADSSYVGEVFSRVEGCSRDVLECGSGLTTLAAALAGERQGITIWSLEQDENWADLVDRRMRRNKFNNVVLRHAPLKDYGGYVWYEVSELDLPEHFELVVCDGPAVRDTWGEAHILWRYGVLPVLKSRGITVGEIILDDATEPRGENLLRRWSEEFAMTHQMVRAEDGDYAVVAHRG